MGHFGEVASARYDGLSNAFIGGGPEGAGLRSDGPLRARKCVFCPGTVRTSSVTVDRSEACEDAGAVGEEEVAVAGVVHQVVGRVGAASDFALMVEPRC